MRKFSVVLLIPMFALFLLSSTALATLINPSGGGDDSETSLQGVFNNMTSPYPGVSSVDVNKDQVAFDSYWSISGSGGSLATIVIEIAGYADSNTFGIFDSSDPSKKVQIFAGSDTKGSQALLSIKDDGKVILDFTDTGKVFASNSFGYYLTNKVNQTFYSDTALNTDAFDHLVAFQGKGVDTIKIGDFSAGVWSTGEYVLAWEDLYGGGDWDYNDMVVMVESVNPAPVPEPATMLLLGTGLIGLAGFGRKSLLKK